MPLDKAKYNARMKIYNRAYRKKKNTEFQLLKEQSQQTAELTKVLEEQIK